MPDTTVTIPSEIADTAAAVPASKVYRPVFTGTGPVRDNSLTDESINTTIIDSIAADTVSGRIPHFIPVEKADSLRLEAMADSLRSIQPVIAEPPSGIREGIAPSDLKSSDSHSTSLSALLMAMLLFLCLNTSSLRQALKTYRHDLIGVRRRRNVFDEGHTASLPMSVLLALNLIVFEGIVLYNIPGLPPLPRPGAAMIMMAIAGAYYIFRYAAYKVVGYVFADQDGRRQWIDGFLATEAYTGLLLIIPALLLVFMPQWHDALVIISLSIICIGRFLFLTKGVRIFYVNLRSLLYFILYLCTLEIIPVLALYGICVYMQAASA